MKKVLMLAAATAAIFSACNFFGEYKTTDTGLKYKIADAKKSGKKPVEGDVLTLSMDYSITTNTNSDSMVYNTRTMSVPMKLPLMKPSHKGSIEEGFALMEEGDSAVFLVNVDSLFAKTFGGQVPEFVKKGSEAKFHVRLVKVEAKAEVEAAEKKAFEEALVREKTDIAQYVKDNNITVSPTESGMYVIVRKAGNGPQAAAGKTISFNYTGRFLDGRLFDTNVEADAKKENRYDSNRPYKPVDSPIGQGRLIKGWEEALVTMKAGTKATLIIPSSLAYGERGAPGAIPPFTPLTFDLELVSVK